MNNKLINFLGVFVLALLGLSFYLAAVKQDVVTPQKRLRVSASIFPLYDMVKNVAGDKADVVLVLPIGASEHTFEPTPREQSEVENSSIVFVVGNKLDDWVLKLVDNSSTSVIAVDKNIELLKYPDGSTDPHYWLSIKNAIIMTDNITETLANEDPVNIEYYRGNAYRYKLRLSNLLNDLSIRSGAIEGSKIVTFHEAFAYLAKEYKVEIVATIEEFPGKEPSSMYLSEVHEIVKDKGVKVLFSEPQLSDAIVSSLANDLGIKVYALDPVGGAEGRDSYEKLIEYNVTTLTIALADEK